MTASENNWMNLKCRTLSKTIDLVCLRKKISVMKEKQEGVGKHFRIKVLCNDVTTKYNLYAVS